MHIQIISYKSATFFNKLIVSLNALVKNGHKIIVHFLENSEQMTLPAIEEEHPSFEYTYDQNPDNIGFSKGHNFLFNKYHSDYEEEFIILNPDTLVFYDMLDQIRDFKKKIDKNWGIIELTQFPKEHPKDFSANFATEWASCAGAVIKTSTFENLCGFDENIFMYCEDIDLSWRVRETGLGVYHCPFAKFAHITRDLDTEKDPTFETIQSLAGNLYLRYKYFGKEKVQKYMELIKNRPHAQKIRELFDKMNDGLDPEEVKRYRKFKTPKIYPDENYAFHRWH